VKEDPKRKRRKVGDAVADDSSDEDSDDNDDVDKGKRPVTGTTSRPSQRPAHPSSSAPGQMEMEDDGKK